MNLALSDIITLFETNRGFLKYTTVIPVFGAKRRNTGIPLSGFQLHPFPHRQRHTLIVYQLPRLYTHKRQVKRHKPPTVILAPHISQCMIQTNHGTKMQTTL